MSNQIERFFEGLRGKRIAVCGIGVSNTPLIEMLVDGGAFVTACDKRTREELGETADAFERKGITLKLGAGYLTDINADILFRTPGMPFTLPQLTAYRRDGMIVTSEMEVFFKLCPAPIIAVTGSDGKTTTTTLIAEMLKAAGKHVFLGGNIGAPLLPLVKTITPADYAVVELSSFQLISMRQSPHIAVVTNITPNHLDVHKDMNEYIEAKRNILLHQDAFGCAVLGADNALTASFEESTRGNVFWFSRHQAVGKGCYLGADSMIYYASGNQIQPLLHKDEILLPGLHNVENYLAAISAVWGIADVSAIRAVATRFAGVEHRIELVREAGGVKWYNDSIASSPTRTIAGLHSFDQKIILIAGGYDKHIPFDALGPEIIENVKALILLGATADKIEATVTADSRFHEGSPPIVRVNTMEEAVLAASGHSARGDIVMLSPACASYDLYANFAERGAHFKKLVQALSVPR